MTRLRMRLLALLMVSMVGCASSTTGDRGSWTGGPVEVLASDRGPETGPLLALMDEVGAKAESEARAEAAEEEPRNAASIMAGGAFVRGDGGAATIGFDYVRHVSKWWSIGPYTDLAFGRRFAWVGGVGFWWHPWRDLLVEVGPGVEYNEGHWNPMVRTGVLYEWEVGEIWLAPGVYVDFIHDSHTDVVLGLSLIRKW